MKNYILILSFLLLAMNPSQAQQDDVSEPIYEYASVYMKVFYQGNILSYKTKGIYQHPLLSMPDGTMYVLYDAKDENNLKEFTNINDVLNYMAGYGWRMKETYILTCDGDNSDNKPGILNTNEYCQYIIFEKRKVKQ